mmetsp:Transcript_30148/g.65117  ORF Transcript_30148/g.65117 Transcript_30148/m.65117 type:complete len:328 (-) Transcript_30148:267-1250(-)
MRVLPIGEPAFRMGLLNAAISAGAAGLVAGTVGLRTGGDLLSAMTAGLLFAVSPIVWHFSTHPEVFALNNLLVALVVAAAAHLATAREKSKSTSNIFRPAGVAAFAMGLCVCNQHTAALTVLPLTLWAVTCHIRSSKVVGLCALIFTIGLLPQLYLPIASARDPPVLWGAVHTAFVEGFLRHVLRWDYGSWSLASDWGTAQTQNASLSLGLQRYFEALPEQMTWPGVAAASAGVVLPWTSSSQLYPGGFEKCLTVTWLFYILFFFWRNNLTLIDPDVWGVVISRFTMQPNLLLCTLAGGGLSRLPRSLYSEIMQTRHWRISRTVLFS